MHALLTPVGSSGDVDPFLILGQALVARGHEVTLLTAEPFRAAAERAGLRFVSTWSAADYEAATQDPDLWHPRKGLELVLCIASEHLRRGYALVEQHYEHGRTLLVGHTLAFATRVLEEAREAPAATVQLAPSVFRSEHRLPVFAPGVDFTPLPRWLKRLALSAVDRFGVDPGIAPALNALRRDLGLPAVKRVFHEWIHSPRCVLGFFPASFGEPQPDWPAQLELVGFVLSDPSCAPSAGIDPALERFLAEGPPPVVLTPGSANRHARAFFVAGLEACARLGRRALLVTKYEENVPAELSDDALHVAYAPFATLFPRAAAVCHHAGIGTSAQALVAGVPQLVMPMGFDQFDNAARLRRLGVGAALRPPRFTARRVAAALESLLASADVAAACRRLRAEIQATDAVGRACELLERQFEARARV